MICKTIHLCAYGFILFSISRFYDLFRLEQSEEEQIEDFKELTPLYDHKGINSPQSSADERYDVPQTALTVT